MSNITYTIDIVYLNDAYLIHKEWLDSQNNIELNEDFLKNIIDKLNSIEQKAADEIKNTSAENGKIIALNALEDLQEAVSKIDRKIDPLRDKIIILKKQADILWNNLKSKYPDKSEEDIANEVKIYVASKVNI